MACSVQRPLTLIPLISSGKDDIHLGSIAILRYVPTSVLVGESKGVMCKICPISEGSSWEASFSETFSSFESQLHTIIVDETSGDDFVVRTSEPDPSGMTTLALDVFETPDLSIITSTHAGYTTCGLDWLTISDCQECEFFSLSDSAFASIAPSRDTSGSQPLLRYLSVTSATGILRDLPTMDPKRLLSVFLHVQSRVLSSGDAVMPPVRVCSMSMCSTPSASL